MFTGTGITGTCTYTGTSGGNTFTGITGCSGSVEGRRVDHARSAERPGIYKWSTTLVAVGLPERRHPERDRVPDERRRRATTSS